MAKQKQDDALRALATASVDLMIMNATEQLFELMHRVIELTPADEDAGSAKLLEQVTIPLLVMAEVVRTVPGVAEHFILLAPHAIKHVAENPPVDVFSAIRKDHAKISTEAQAAVDALFKGVKT